MELPQDISKNVYKNLVAWKALPKGKTAPKNIAEFASKMGVDKQKLLDIVNDPQFAEDVRLEALSWAKLKVPEILQILYTEIKKTKSTTDAERFMKIAYESERKDKESNSQVNIINNILSDEQYKKIVAREARLLD